MGISLFIGKKKKTFSLVLAVRLLTGEIIIILENRLGEMGHIIADRIWARSTIRIRSNTEPTRVPVYGVFSNRHDVLTINKCFKSFLIAQAQIPLFIAVLYPVSSKQAYGINYENVSVIESKQASLAPGTKGFSGFGQPIPRDASHRAREKISGTQGKLVRVFDLPFCVSHI